MSTSISITNLFLLFVIVHFVPVSAIAKTMPASAQEFRDAVKAGGHKTYVLHVKIGLPYNKVVNALKRNGLKCFNVTVKRRGAQTRYGSSPTFTRFTAYFKNKSKSSAELVVQLPDQLRFRIGPKAPAGGFYLMVIDIEAGKGNNTNLIAYVSTYSIKNLESALTSWANSKSHACTKFAGRGKYIYK